MSDGRRCYCSRCGARRFEHLLLSTPGGSICQPDAKGNLCEVVKGSPANSMLVSMQRLFVSLHGVMPEVNVLPGKTLNKTKVSIQKTFKFG